MTSTGRKKRATTDDKKPVGRPEKFKSVQELQKLIDAYFNSCEEEVWIKKLDPETGELLGWEPQYDRHGNVLKRMVKPYTISGLALALGTTRRTLLDYEQRDDEFSHTIKKAKSRCEEFAEEQLFTSKNTAGVIFNLKNNYESWVDKQEQKIDATVTKKLEDFFT